MIYPSYTLTYKPTYKFSFVEISLGMGTIPIPSIDTVDTCELGVTIDTSTKYR